MFRGTAARVADCEPDYPYLRFGHAHNDYRHRRPLFAALHFGYASIEVDVWPVRGELLVGHGRRELSPHRTLTRLYLDPLAERVRRLGAVYPGAARGLQLLVEAKHEPVECCTLLAAQLGRYPGLFTRYAGDVLHGGPITVVVTGAGTPHEFVGAQHDRLLGCDGTLAEVSGKRLPPQLVPLVSERWTRMFRWRGNGPFPDRERRRLVELVERVHADGRALRFWGGPSWRSGVRRRFWRALATAGVDYVGADHLRELADLAADLDAPAHHSTPQR